MLIQLSGVPGSGKSTLARAIAVSRRSVVVDTDVIKSALLSEAIPFGEAGRATYAAALALAGDLLAQAHDVVLDSPCRYPELLESGMTAARTAGVPYGFIELTTDDLPLLLSRLDRRTPRRSQVASSTEPVVGTTWELGTAEATLTAWQHQLVRPERGALTLDAALDVTQHMALVTPYLDERARGVMDG